MKPPSPQARSALPRRTLLIVVAVGCAILAAAGVVIWLVGSARTAAEPTQQITPSEEPSASPSTTPDTGATPAPPTAPVLPETPGPGAGGEDPLAPPAPEPVAPLPAGTVSVTLTFVATDTAAGVIQAGGYADVIDDAGVCSLVLTHDGETVRTELPAQPDATTTSCGGFSIPLTGMAPGSWSAVLEFASPTGDGRSDVTQVNIP
ncbi:hypothetical protein ACFP63_09875 [Oerskovia jenensis]|uniref:Cytoskeletal protein RodZ n=1 Tax=Oerskovia jenensis TaxID=162169 RepID=A0ABS2LJ32_9CELL|nr:hypothetical protein [Oerskovia jenensis]MBM7480367.1 cytoskeletal protein RodZ [Oerskovia jenensis]